MPCCRPYPAHPEGTGSLRASWSREHARLPDSRQKRNRRALILQEQAQSRTAGTARGRSVARTGPIPRGTGRIPCYEPDTGPELANQRRVQPGVPTTTRRTHPASRWFPGKCRRGGAIRPARMPTPRSSIGIPRCSCRAESAGPRDDDTHIRLFPQAAACLRHSHERSLHRPWIDGRRSVRRTRQTGGAETTVRQAGAHPGGTAVK